MKIKNYIKTKCGIEKYNFLKNDAEKSFIKKGRFFFFIFVAVLRDLFKKY
tara:strand:- start:320 stop:469 length:150 start_codon:yes stop_codon:yes gene_type:complete